MEETYKCWRCGKEISLRYEPRERVYCDECWTKEQQEHKELVQKYAELKIKVMHDNALRIMEKSNKCYMHEYAESAKRILHKALENTENFMSSHEMVVAIILDNYGFQYETNYKILNYRVDFYLPEFCACLEVDGAQHSHKLEYDSRRDNELRNALGKEWEIVRIKTGYIEENPEKIIDAVEALANEKRRLRAKNSGIMPYGFSKRDNALYDSVLRKKR